eukprot:TRINITY_DN4442_c0_g1_i2.p1 TRINITY_DN4442_c0_g1~~TRINITY_DN4442_c0_g1_i2.p1  ORF type:complete len:144 (+),score=3.52 TRINITY_DN4442_c0_g1_i2:178-609(+)
MAMSLRSTPSIEPKRSQPMRRASSVEISSRATYEVSNEETEHAQLLASSLEKRMRAMTSLATVAFVIFGFSSSSLLQPDLFLFQNEEFRERFVVLMAMTVLLSAFSGFTFVTHYYIGERLQSGESLYLGKCICFARCCNHGRD